MIAEQKEYVLLEFEDGWVPAPNTRFSLSVSTYLIHALRPTIWSIYKFAPTFLVPFFCALGP